LIGSGAQGSWTADDDLLPKNCRAALANRAPPAESAAWRQRLYRQRLGPVEQQLVGVRHLIVLSAGSMAEVPVEALTERFTISYAPSGTILANLRLKARRQVEAPRLLALGDPTFSVNRTTNGDEPPAIALSRRAGSARWADLPGTRHEVAAVAPLFPEAVILLGSHASEQRLEQLARAGELRRFTALHFATHGQIDRATAARSALVLAQDQLPDPRQQVLQSQRVFDGRLEVAEVLREWQLDAELVALSACDTGLGPEGGGEGLMGFSQALLARGAKSLLVSLWPVSDTATSLLMVRFYENWLGARDGKARSKAVALKEAKDWLRNLTRKEVDERLANLPEAARGLKLEPAAQPQAASEKPFEHPYYWAAFVLIGDPD
jgi:CHAT domain-containing protein